MTSTTSVAVAVGHDGTTATLKLATEAFEVNVWLSAADVVALRRVPTTGWENGAVRIGTSAGASVFWSVDDDTLSLLIGHDDQTWDVSLAMPCTVVPVIIAELARSGSKA